MFEGVYTAIVTPFTESGEVDFETFGQLIETQVEGGVSGLVPVGTTGESPTLNMNEHQKVIEFTIERLAGRGKVIAGAGGNSTEEALELTQHAKAAGADGCLQVTPYYNKPSQRGLIKHFTAIADIGLPVVLYNIPGRTSRELTVDTVVALSRHPNITCIKEAAGDVDRVSAYRAACDIEVVSGDDSLALPMMSVGGVGVISVAANVVPAEMVRMVKSALNGDWAEAQATHAKLYPLFKDLFIDTNPVPVKAALAMMGAIKEVYRLPMCEMEDGDKARLHATMSSMGLVD